MKKYFQILKLTLQEYLVYRLNFLLWRFRSFVSFITLLIFWQAVYGSKTLLFGYQKPQMIAYVLGAALLRGIIISSRSADMAGQIRNGDLTSIILKPLNVFKFWLSKDFADKMLNFVFVFGELFLVLKILRVDFYLPKEPVTYLLFFLVLILAVFLYFFTSFVISATAFWTDDIWAARWLFGVIFLEFMAGNFFPIDVLPKTLANIFYLTPFPYLIYFPIKIWNEQITGLMALKAILICLIWLVVFYFLAKKIWEKGVKNYGAYCG
ncbi:hypothetical protein COT64_03415 [Candidatus Shapirobacteria bacterium CG09_land_8_20_14_0_10_39_12]|uniref:ABC transporter permease n=1 Tax=Candidatus Shapirobacteria bacterium CG09_land_8_20_14_0_10_39_12 TaxID=1974885 RepID=A0A2H0WNS0_9BACT|nr:MAG: hypothetical protein COT64_03415 [Candidatus Shapirobacteria bacterium CG09_land_8_20_14_0_10_39_12]